jgi:hypothetical protein
MATTHYIDTDRQWDGPPRFLDAGAKVDNEGEQQEDNDGNPKFTVQLMVKDRDSGRFEIIKVTVVGDGKSVPCAGFTSMQAVTTVDIKQGSYVDRAGKALPYYGATAVVAQAAQAAAPVAKAS